MALNIHNRSLLSLMHHSERELQYLLDLSRDLKRAKYSGTERQHLKGKNIALIFEKTSTRTRCAFEVAAYDQSANVTYIDPNSSQIGHKESMKDTARVLGRLYDAIEYRGFKQEIVEELARYAGVPVYNGLTDEYHPTQMIADVMTMREHSDKPLHQISYAYLGDARNNMGNSLLLIGAKLGMDVRIAAPRALWPSEQHVKACEEFAAQSGAPAAHRGYAGGGARRRLHPHRRLGLDGRADGRLGRAHPAAAALPGERGADAGEQQSAGEVHALPAGVPQQRDQGRQGDRHALSAPGQRYRGHRGGVRIPGLHCLRAGGEPHAHHQGDPGLHPRRHLT